MNKSFSLSLLLSPMEKEKNMDTLSVVNHTVFHTGTQNASRPKYVAVF